MRRLQAGLRVQIEAFGEPPTKCFISKTLMTFKRFVKLKIPDVGVPGKNSYYIQVPFRGEKLPFFAGFRSAYWAGPDGVFAWPARNYKNLFRGRAILNPVNGELRF